MIYRIFIGLLILSVFIYYIFCFLQIFEVVRFTEDGVDVEIPQMFIPFYYLFKKAKKEEVPEEEIKEPEVKEGTEPKQEVLETPAPEKPKRTRQPKNKTNIN